MSGKKEEIKECSHEEHLPQTYYYEGRKRLHICPECDMVTKVIPKDII